MRNKKTCLPVGRVALYNPYLDTLGGGEKHILSILKVLQEEGFEINIFWDKDLTEQIEEKFSLHYINKLEWLPNIFKNKTFPFSTLKTLQTLRTFNYFFYVTDGSYFFSTAKKNFVFCMVPQKNLYPYNIINILKTWNYQFIANSQFTGNWLNKWGIKNQVIHPYIDDVFINSNVNNKEKNILSVGRFFPHLHSKQQEVVIKLFKKIKKNGLFRDYKLIIAGGLKKEDKDYFHKLKALVNNDKSIYLKPNLNFDELYKLYKLSNFFWHFTGYGIDENIHPEQVEHLGITPLEAMASGCITFCYNAGGPKEIIKNGETGFLFNNEKELIEKMELCIKNQELSKKIINNAKKYVKENFSYEVLKKRVREVILCKP